MRVFVAAFMFSSLGLLFLACGNSNDATPPAAAPTAGYAGYPPPGYPPGYAAPPPGQPQQAPPPGYPTASYPPGYATAAPTYAPPAPAPAPTYAPAPVATYTPPPGPAPAPAPTPAPTSTAPMSTPGLLALPCQNDAVCGLHHCNTQYGKCAFPCQTGVDCVSNNCVMGVCLPGTGS